MSDPMDFKKARDFNIAKLREDVATGQRSLRVTSHAQVEAFKDGLLLADLRYAFEKGEHLLDKSNSGERGREQYPEATKAQAENQKVNRPAD